MRLSIGPRRKRQTHTSFSLKTTTLHKILKCYNCKKCIKNRQRCMLNDHLDAQIFSMYLFQNSTCFEQPRAHHQGNQFYQYNIRYMSLSVCDLFLRRSERTCTRNGHRHRVTYTRGCIDTIDSPDDEHKVARDL